jgi:hypothetical protein
MDPYLIDELGIPWDAKGPALRRHLMTSIDGDRLCKVVVENLGWVKLSPQPRSFGVACRPAFLSDETLAAVLMAVYDAGERTIRLDVLDKSWEHLVLPDRRSFVRLLSALVSGRRRNHWSKARLIRSFSLRDCPLRLATKMAVLTASMASEPEEAREALDAIFHGRWHLCKIDSDNGHSIPLAIGRSFTPFNPGWCSSGVGVSICSYADDAYGLWVAAHHRDVLATGRPVFDDVDAVVTFPRIGETRLRYRRVTSPLTFRGGGRLVLGAAVTDSSVNLRELAS